MEVAKPKHEQDEAKHKNGRSQKGAERPAFDETPLNGCLRNESPHTISFRPHAVQ